eukprot:m.97230 g.97230  ORF g.97230 m.97230 type:complete len:1279 (-) comp26959_c0_seq2:66-3902(-)
MPAPPEITGLSPSRGPGSGGVCITLRGTNLGTRQDDVKRVTFNGQTSTDIKWISSSKVECLLPPGEGSGPVKVITGTGGTGGSMTFTYDHEPDSSDDDVEPETSIGLTTQVDRWIEDEVVQSSARIGLGLSNDVTEDPLSLRAPHQTASEGVIPEVFEDLYPEGSKSLEKKNFEPAWCLADLYGDVSMEELENGKASLEQLVHRQGDSRQVLLNNHAGSFIDSFKAVADVDKRIQTGHGLSYLKTLQQSVTVVTEFSEQIFQPMIVRRRECEKDRNALMVLRDNHFLFSLPKNLKQKLEEQAWDVVIRDYHHATVLFAKTTIKVFEQIMAVVERIIEDVRKTLFSKLQEQTTMPDGRKRPLAYEELSKLIGYLHALDAKPDPAWFCLLEQKKHVLEELQRCGEQLKQQLADPSETMGQRYYMLRNRFSQKLNLVSDDQSLLMRTLSYQPTAHTKHEFDLATPRSSFASQTNLGAGDVSRYASRNSLASVPPTISDTAPQLQFVEEISQDLNLHLPSMWKLGQSSLQRSADLAKASAGARVEDDGNVEEFASTASDEKTQELELMVMGVIDAYAVLVRECIMSDPDTTHNTNDVDDDNNADNDNNNINNNGSLDEANRQQAQHQQASIRGQFDFQRSISAPSRSNSDSSQRMLATTTAPTTTSHASKHKHKRDWLPKCEAQIRKCLRFLSAIGLTESCLSGMLELLNDFQHYTVTEVFRETNHEVNQLIYKEDWRPADNGLHTSLPELYEEIMVSSLASLSELCNNPATDQDILKDNEGEELMCVPQEALKTCFEKLAYDKTVIASAHVKSVAVEPEQRLMLVMSNCLYTRKLVSITLAHKFSTLRLGDLGSNFDDSLRAFEELDVACFRSLLTRRSLELIALAQQGVHTYTTSIPSKLQVRAYTKEILLNLVKVHADVNEYSRPFIFRVVSQLAVRVARAFHKAVVALGNKLERDAHHHHHHHLAQLTLELTAIQTVLKSYDRDQSIWGSTLESLSSFRHSLPLPQTTPLPTPTTTPQPQLIPSTTSSLLAASTLMTTATTPSSSTSSPRLGRGLGRSSTRRRASTAKTRPLPTPGSRALPTPGSSSLLGGTTSAKTPPIPGSTSALLNSVSTQGPTPTPYKQASTLLTRKPSTKRMPTPGGKASNLIGAAPTRTPSRPTPTPSRTPRPTSSRTSRPTPTPKVKSKLTLQSTLTSPVKLPPRKVVKVWTDDEIKVALTEFLRITSFQFACFKDKPVQDIDIGIGLYDRGDDVDEIEAETLDTQENDGGDDDSDEDNMV